MTQRAGGSVWKLDEATIVYIWSLKMVPSAKPREGVQKQARQGYSLSSGYSEAE